MLSNKLSSEQLDIITKFKNKYALDTNIENILPIIHLMCKHKIDKDTALDQTSRGGEDFGIDAWFYDKKNDELFIYQSKYSENKNVVSKGFEDLIRSINFLEKIFIEKQIDKLPSTNAIYNLYLYNLDKVKKINFVLLTLLDEDSLENDKERTEREIQKTKLYEVFNKKGVEIYLKIEKFNINEAPIPNENKKYKIQKFRDTIINLNNDTYLQISFVSLYDLIMLYREKGDDVFHKNIRLSLNDYQESRNLVGKPLEKTLESICHGTISSNIFPFYHVGVTIAASYGEINEEKREINLERPYIVNGCQSVITSEKFLRELENNKMYEKIEKFKEIKVLCKIITGASDDALKEITINNNRQNPIENWQLFSNDYIHLKIEEYLKSKGIFYERQKGKFNTIMTKPNLAKEYHSTNKTFIDIKTLGQLISLSNGIYQYAAKPSEIFINQKRHDSIFTKDIPTFSNDIVLCFNLYKALKRGFDKYLEGKVSYNDDNLSKFFNKPIVRAHIYRTALLYYYQKENISDELKEKLHNKASSLLVDEFEKIYKKFLSKIKSKYPNFNVDEDKKNFGKNLTKFFETEIFKELDIKDFKELEKKQGYVPLPIDTKIND